MTHRPNRLDKIGLEALDRETDQICHINIVRRADVRQNDPSNKVF